jgi:hypothetical protein
MPAFRVGEHFDVIEDIPPGLLTVVIGFSRFSNWKKLSATALSWQFPRRLMLGTKR